jgi:hypothetical protein
MSTPFFFSFDVNMFVCVCRLTSHFREQTRNIPSYLGNWQSKHKITLRLFTSGQESH